jgi:hypothetical protein
VSLSDTGRTAWSTCDWNDRGVVAEVANDS